MPEVPAVPGTRRFPVALTVTVAVCLTILVALGVWQLERLKWKQSLLGRVAALRTAPAVAIGPVLARAKAGEDVDWTRVEVTCAETDLNPTDAPVYALREGTIVWRALTGCELAKGPYSFVILDRGYVENTAGATAEPAAFRLPAPRHVVGVLRRTGRDGKGGVLVTHLTDGADNRPAFTQMTLVAEREDPAPPGVTPSALPADIPNNHLSYALTWFGLAAALAGVYAAMLLRRRKTP